jgi:heat shock protein HslJ
MLKIQSICLFLVVLLNFSCRKEADRNLENTWIAVTMKGVKSASSNENKPNLTIKGAGFTGFSGCNSFGGDIQISKNGDAFSVKVKDLAATQIFCGTISNFENAFFEVLGEADNVRISGDELRFFKGSTELGRMKAQ